MAPRKKVPSLLDLSLQAHQKQITIILNYVIDGDRVSLRSLTSDIGTLLNVNAQPPLKDRIAKNLLQTLEQVLKDYSTQAPRLLPKCKTVVKHFVAVLPLLQLEEISIFDYDWSEVVYSSLLSLLDKMPSLKDLSVCTNIDAYKHCPLAQQLTNNFHLLSNLTSFAFSVNATDPLIAAICKNCKAIRKIYVSESDKISDWSISSLIKCPQLRVINLTGTSVSPEGYFDLLTKSKSDILDVGRIYLYPLKLILNLLEKHLRPFRSFSLQHLDIGSGLNVREFCLVFKYFPHLEELSVKGVCSFDHLSVSRFKNLTQISFDSLEDEVNQLSSLFSARGPFITSLTFDLCFEMRGKCFVDIAASCPNIESLRIFGAVKKEGPNFLDTVFPTKPFQKLRQFTCDLNISLAYLKFVLCNASGIQVVDLKTKEIGDEFFESVFQSNPLKQLKSLKIEAEKNEISARMLSKIINNCPNITNVIYLGNATAVTKRELKRFRAYIVANNYDLNLSNIDPIKVEVANIIASL